jgi:hypothetical protein
VRSVNIFYALLISLGFLFVSFALKLFSIMTFGTVLVNLAPENVQLSILAAAAIAIVLSGLLIGKIINLAISELPLYHALGIAIMASILKWLRPDYDPISDLAHVALVALTFISINWGAYVFRKQSA